MGWSIDAFRGMQMQKHPVVWPHCASIIFLIGSTLSGPQNETLYIYQRCIISIGRNSRRFFIRIFFCVGVFCTENSPTTQSLAEWKDIDGKRSLWTPGAWPQCGGRGASGLSRRRGFGRVLRKYFETIRTNPGKFEQIRANLTRFG